MSQPLRVIGRRTSVWGDILAELIRKGIGSEVRFIIGTDLMDSTVRSGIAWAAKSHTVRVKITNESGGRVAVVKLTGRK